MRIPLLLTAAVLFAGGCSSSNDEQQQDQPEADANLTEVKYEVPGVK